MSNGAENGDSNHVPAAIEPSANVAFLLHGKSKNQKSNQKYRGKTVEFMYLAFIWKKAEFVSLYLCTFVPLVIVPLSLFFLFLITHTLYPTFSGGLDIVTPYLSIHR